MRRATCLAAAMFGAAMAYGVGARAGNIVENPGFEADNASQGAVTPITDWTISGAAAVVGVEQGFSHAGNNAAYIGNGTLSQNLTTVAGTTYQISFWVGIANSDTLNDPNATFSASIGGQDLLGGAMPPGPPLPGSFIQCPDPTNACYAETGDTFTATSTTSTIAFTGVVSNVGELWYVDDVAVTSQDTGPIPEPATLALLGVGLLGVRMVRRRTA